MSGKKSRPYPKGWRGQVVRVLYNKAIGATDGAQNMMLMTRMEDNLTPIKIKTWTYRNVSG